MHRLGLEQAETVPQFAGACGILLVLGEDDALVKPADRVVYPLARNDARSRGVAPDPFCQLDVVVEHGMADFVVKTVRHRLQPARGHVRGAFLELAYDIVQIPLVRQEHVRVGE